MHKKWLKWSDDVFANGEHGHNSGDQKKSLEMANLSMDNRNSRRTGQPEQKTF